MRFKFAHLADLHLDTPFHGLRADHPELAAALRDASLDAWDRAVEACLAANVSFVLLAGDVYDNQAAGVRAQLRFRAGLERLGAHGVQSFMVHGNHDPRGGRWSAIGAWPDGVTVFGHDGVTSAPVLRGGEQLALVHGMSYPQPQVTENLAARFRRDAGFGGFQIGLLHANVDGRGGHENYAPASLADLRSSGLDYWALGHVHARAVLSPERPLAVYPGNLQARHFGEQGPKGFYLIDVEDGRPSPTFLPVAPARFETLELDVADLADLGAVHDRLVGAAQSLRAAEGTWVLRADVHGSGPCHHDLRRAGEDGLRGYLQDVAPPGVWWDEVRLRTRPPLNRAARLRAGDFAADLLVMADRLRAGAPDRVASLVEELRRHPRLRSVAAGLGLEDLAAEAAELWGEAEALAFDLVAAEQGEG